MSRKLKSPAFQWYPRDYISSTRVTMMSLVEEAIYRKLLDYCWLEGSVSADPQRILRLIGKEADIDSVREVLTMFTKHSDDESRLVHDRLEIEREKQANNSAKRSAAANKRWGNQEKDANAMQMHTTSNAGGVQKQCLTSTITSSSTTTTTPTINNNTPKHPKKEWKPDEIQIRLNKCYKRRNTTKWSDAELKAYKKNDYEEEDVKLMVRYCDPKNGSAYRRKDIKTLLNNWNSEVDRANGWEQEGKPEQQSFVEINASAKKDQFSKGLSNPLY